MAKPAAPKKAAKPSSSKQRKHNPKSRQPRPLPDTLNREVQWISWPGSKEHLFPLGQECPSTGTIPEKYLPNISVRSAAKQFRDYRTCVACFYRYVTKQAQLREKVSRTRPTHHFPLIPTSAIVKESGELLVKEA